MANITFTYGKCLENGLAEMPAGKTVQTIHGIYKHCHGFKTIFFIYMCMYISY